ncbi:MAG: putative lipoprotein [Gammaproteobacteria bacterium]
MNRRHPSQLFIALVLAALTTSGCSFSTSSESSSDSSKSIFNIGSSPLASSSDSSLTAHQKFENDVADYTAEYLKSSSGTLDQFRDHLSELAESHGISNWESDHSTYVAIGRGLKKADLGAPQVSAFTDSFSENDPMKKQAIQDGLNQ